jgi:acyl transferase domain-containing protein
LLLDPGVFQVLSSGGFLSPDGVCYSFDHRANGYARGEGFISLVLKPVSAAVRDGDMIRAVIRSIGSNQDGHTPVLTQPSAQSQEDLIRHVYERAGLSYDQTRYVEAHGKYQVAPFRGLVSTFGLWWLTTRNAHRNGD